MTPRLFWLAGFLIGALFAFYLVSGAVSVSVAGDRWFCTRCHQMNATVAAWERSPHRGVACVWCHSEPGPIGYLAANVSSVNILLDTLNGAWKYEVPIHATVNDSSCLSCHRSPIRGAQDKIVVPGSEQPVHWGGKTFSVWDTYAAGYHCVQCHSTLVEGDLVPVAARTYPQAPAAVFSAEIQAQARAWLDYLSRQR